MNCVNSPTPPIPTKAMVLVPGSSTIFLMASTLGFNAVAVLGRSGRSEISHVLTSSLSLWLVIPLPALTALSSLFQGTLINSQRTRRITEADSLSLAAVTALLTLGSLLGGRPCGPGSVVFCGVPGVFIAVAAFNFGAIVLQRLHPI